MIRPKPWATIGFSARRVAQNVEFRHQSSASCQASSLRSSTSAKPLEPPALFTRMWTPPKRSIGGVDQPLDIGLRSDVTGDEHRPVATAELLERGRALVGVAPGDHHRRALGEERGSDPLPDSLRPTGDDGHLVLQQHLVLRLHGGSLSVDARSP